MVSNVSRAVAIYREEGVLSLLKRSLQYGYNSFIRPLLPTVNADYNGVKVPNARLGDRFSPWHTVDVPNYEGALVAGIREHVQPRERVVVVGGGWGVSTVSAAQKVGPKGQLDVFEGSEDAIENVRATVHVNDVAPWVNTHHAVVAQAHSLRGESGGATEVSPSDLPECDVLVLDCEGAELEILDELSVTPHTILVETHGMLDAPESAVVDRLTEQGYNVINREVAEARVREFCLENEIFVLTAKR